mgnify:CR=1 FL=1
MCYLFNWRLDCLDTAMQPLGFYELLKMLTYGENPTNLTDLISKAKVHIFDFEYGIKSEAKVDFEIMFIRHFLNRRIGYETYSIWKNYLITKLYEIIPKYNLMFNAIDNWDIFLAEKEVREQLTNTSSIAHTDTESVSKQSNNGSNQNASVSADKVDQRFSDTPQNKLADIQNGTYLSSYQLTQTDSTASTANVSSNSNTIGAKSGATARDKASGNLNETITRTNFDVDRYLKFQNNFDNIISQMFKDLDCLFYQIIE